MTAHPPHLHSDHAPAPAAAAAGASLADGLNHYLEQQLQWCNRLEQLADQLPEAADPQECLLLAQGLLPLVKRAHTFEEETVFPQLLARCGSTAAATTGDSGGLPAGLDLKATVERLRFEHLGDEDFATDLSHALRQFVTERAHCNVDSLAWMLRGFFESLRRHIAFEREHVMPLMQRAAL